MTLPRQLSAYALVGVAASLAHYSALIALVEAARWPAVPATLVGYVIGGVVSYVLNRRHTFDSDRPHEEATWRFALVAFVGFCLTFLLMSFFVDRLGALSAGAAGYDNPDHVRHFFRQPTMDICAARRGTLNFRAI